MNHINQGFYTGIWFTESYQQRTLWQMIGWFIQAKDFKLTSDCLNHSYQKLYTAIWLNFNKEPIKDKWLAHWYKPRILYLTFVCLNHLYQKLYTVIWLADSYYKAKHLYWHLISWIISKNLLRTNDWLIDTNQGFKTDVWLAESLIPKTLYRHVIGWII